jgi:predicted O-methyltransferase YrrM
MLEALPDAKLVSFDLGDLAWADANQKLLSFIYTPRFRYIKGDSALTVQASDGLKCNAFFVDGSKATEARYADVLHFRSLATPHAILFMDEVSSEACARRIMSEADCLANTGGYASTAIAYHRLSKEGTIRVDSCVTTPTAGDISAVLLSECASFARAKGAEPP